MAREYNTEGIFGPGHEEDYFLMMMEALDGELPASSRPALDAHLRACPDCLREWNTLASIDALFRQSPLLHPAVDFAERTLARLPNRRTRVWALSALYGVLLLSGIVPLVLAAFFVLRYSPVLSEPTLLQRVLASLTSMAQVIVTVLDALLAGAARVAAEQPAIVGVLLVMTGIVFVWGGILQRLFLQPQPSGSRI
jgi:anti-sigma factor RsiW